MATMKSFRVEYRDEDPACPIFAMLVRAHDRDSAIERFWDIGADDDGWIVVSVKEVKL